MFYFIIHYYLLKPNIFKEKSEIESFENFIEHMGNFNDLIKDTTVATLCPSKKYNMNKKCKGIHQRCISDSNGKNNCCDKMNCILTQDNFQYKVCSFKKDPCLNYESKNNTFNWKWNWKWNWKKICK